MASIHPFALAFWTIPIAIVLGVVLCFRKYNFGRRPGLVEQWAAMNGRQRLMAVAVLVAFVIAITVSGRLTRAERETILREQFHIPESITFDHYESQTKMRIRPRIAGIVRFSDADYEAYAARVGDAALWSPVSFNYLGSGDITPSARGSGFMWYQLPYPGWAGDITMRWGSMAMDEAQYVKNGRYFCTAILAQPIASPDQPLRHGAKACRDIGRNDTSIKAIMLAVLDHEAKTLYATIY